MKGKIWITIDLIIKDSNLYFTLENSVFAGGKTQMQNSFPGIGLENAKKRLSILYKDYILDNELRAGCYHTFLMIPLC